MKFCAWELTPKALVFIPFEKELQLTAPVEQLQESTLSQSVFVRDGQWASKIVISSTLKLVTSFVVAQLLV